MHEHGVLDKGCYPRISNGFYLTDFYMGFYNHLTIVYIVFACVYKENNFPVSLQCTTK